MADIRKSGKQTAARKLAREKAAEFREKQDKLEQLATDYFVAADSIDDIQASVEKEIAAARARGDKQAQEAKAREATIIASMLDLGVPRNEVADRLGIPTRDVKKPTVKPAATGSPSAAELPSTPDGDTPAA